MTSYLYSYQNDTLTCAEMLLSSQSQYSSFFSILGRKMTYHADASGKVVLANFTDPELEAYIKNSKFSRFTEKTLTEPTDILLDVYKTRRNGYAAEIDEMDIGLAAFSVPIYNQYGTLIGTISVSDASSRLLPLETDIIPTLFDYSRKISEQLETDSSPL